MPRRPHPRHLPFLRGLDRDEILLPDGTVDESKIPQGDATLRPFKGWQTVHRMMEASRAKKRAVLTSGMALVMLTAGLTRAVNADPKDYGPCVASSLPLYAPPTLTNDQADQLFVADCYLIATLGELGRVLPEDYLHFLQYLPGGAARHYYQRQKVQTYIDTALTVPATLANRNGCIWAAISEKCYAKFRTGANTYDSLGWGNPWAVLGDFGYSSGQANVIALTDASLGTLIASKTLARCPMIAVSRGDATGAIAASHAYGVISFDGAMIKLRNPWDTAIISVTPAVFRASFIAIAYTINRMMALPTMLRQTKAQAFHALFAFALARRNKALHLGLSLPTIAPLPAGTDFSSQCDLLERLIAAYDVLLRGK